MQADYAGLLEAAIAQDIQSRFSVGFFDDDSGHRKQEGLIVVEDFSSGGAIIDQATRIVISGWSSAIEQDRPTISKATADGELDFWKKFDETQTSFIKIFLDAPLSLSSSTRLNSYAKPTFEIYENLIRTAHFSDTNTSLPKDIKALKEFLYTTDDIGQLVETEGYALYKRLLNDVHEAMMALEEPDLKKSSSAYTLAQSRLIQAKTELNIRGQKSRFAHAEQTLLNFENSTSSMDEQQKLIERFEASQWDSIAEPGMKYPHTALQNPSIFTSALDSGAWIKVSLSGDALKSDNIIKIAEHLGRDALAIHQALEDINHIEFHYQLFGINRAWLDWNFWTEDYWKSEAIISDGKGGGDLPAIASKLVVVAAFQVLKPVAHTEITFKGEEKVVQQRSVMMRVQKAKVDPEMEAFEKLARKKGIWVEKTVSPAGQPQRFVSRAMVPQGMSQTVQAQPVKSIPALMKKTNRTSTSPPNKKAKKSRRALQIEVATQVGVAATGLLWNWAKNRRNSKEKKLSMTYEVNSVQASHDLDVTLEHIQTGKVTPLLTHKGLTRTRGKYKGKLPYGTYNIVKHIHDREISRASFTFDQDSPDSAHLTINISTEAVYSSSLDQGNFDLMRVFGYLSKSLPRCPTG